MAKDRRSAVWPRLLTAVGPTHATARNLFWVLAMAGALISLLSGCSPIYLIRAAYEEGKILWRRQPIVEFLTTPDLQDDTKEKLTLVLAAREYAHNVLGLNVAGSYASYSYIDRPDLTYIVMAAPKTELRPYTWWFLVVGNVPYKGFFSKSEAQAEVERLQAEGYDTYVRTSAAFSTLGWFDDPLLSHLLKYDKVALTEIVFHELFHNTLYINGAGAFNESAANFVGHRAAIDFFRQRSGADSAEHRRAVRAWEEEREFGEFIEEVVGTLAGLYRRDIAMKDKLRLREEVFARRQSEWARRIERRPSHRFRGFVQQPLNNAVLMHYVVYLKDLQLFESLYEYEGGNLVRTIASLRQATKHGGKPFDALRAWRDRQSYEKSAPAG
ncbi:MAG: aminopeptidase [Candidatus Binatia bacterium]